MFKKQTAVIAFLALLFPIGFLATPVVALEAGEGIIRRFAFVTADNLISTTSGLYVQVPDTTINASTHGPVIANFCAASNNGGVGFEAITVAVDGVLLPFGMAIHGGIQFAAVAADCSLFQLGNFRFGSRRTPLRHTLAGYSC